MITRYKVFIASPGGLEEERKAFQETIREYNLEIDELQRDVSFMPVGWEETRPNWRRLHVKPILSWFIGIL